MPKEIKVKKPIITKTDYSGKIIYGNDEFERVSGYSSSEYLYKPHNLIRHPDMPRVIFDKLWNEIKNNSNFVGIVKNKAKNGDYYWVITNFSIERDENQEFQAFVAERTAVNKKAKLEMESIFKVLNEIEEEGGIEAADIYLSKFLETKNMTLLEFILDLIQRNEGFFDKIKKFKFKKTI